MTVTHSPDERIQLANTNVFPNTAIARIVSTLNDGSTLEGTAFLIYVSADKTAYKFVTAAHCIYLKNASPSTNNGSVSNVSVQPGRNGSTILFAGTDAGTHTQASASWISSSGSGDPNYDYGVIVVYNPPTSWHALTPMTLYSGTSFSNYVSATCCGYPDGTSDAPPSWVAKCQYTATDYVTSANGQLIFFIIDTSHGHSGSPVYDSSNRVIGTYTATSLLNKLNQGIEMTSAVISDINGMNP